MNRVEPKILDYSRKAERIIEATVALASFLVALACARFRILLTSVDDVENEFGNAISEVENLSDFSRNEKLLCMAAEAHVDFSATIEDRMLHEPQISEETVTSISKIQWRHVSKALEEYTAASNLPRVSGLASIHISRGDCEMLRARLAEEPFKYDLAKTNLGIIMKNATIFYGAARKVLSRELSTPERAEEDLEAEVKLDFVATMQDIDNRRFEAFVHSQWQAAQQTLEDMKEQRLISQACWSRIEAILRSSGSI